MAFVTCLIGCSIGRVMNLKRFAALILGTILLGIVITVLQWPTANTLANLGFPFLFLGLITITYRLISIVRKKLPLQLLGRSTLHLGIIVLLIGVFVSSSTQQNFTLLDARPNTIRAVSELTIHLENATVYTGVGRVQLSDRLYPEYSALKLDATIEQEGTSYDCTLWVHLYAAYGVVSTPTIIRTLTQDIYLHIMYNESLSSSLADALFNRKEPPNSFNISVTTMPLIGLVWMGVALLSIGMVIPSISGIRKLSNNQRKHAI
jgi:cytochrome c biogenesis factor